MNNLKSPTIKLLAQAIGDGNIKVHFKHISTRRNAPEGIAKYTFEVNGVRFETGNHEFLDRSSDVMKEGRNEYLISRYDSNTVCWFVEQYDTVMVDVEQRRQLAQAAVNKAMNALLGSCPF